MKRISFAVLFLGLLVTEIADFSACAIATPSLEKSQQFLSELSESITDGKAIGNTSPPPPGGST